MNQVTRSYQLFVGIDVSAAPVHLACSVPTLAHHDHIPLARHLPDLPNSSVISCFLSQTLAGALDSVSCGLGDTAL